MKFFNRLISGIVMCKKVNSVVHFFDLAVWR